eukprot:gnl/Trimastix_PCT/1614.p2 GENE.gnl/Trimastix_PCT/1614~~gnl/Trimastix_PCT/1614.p2  ORF type:complete len:140 (+),score=19.02 gnl/Trimastix_PCT/1614:37-456(+)
MAYSPFRTVFRAPNLRLKASSLYKPDIRFIFVAAIISVYMVLAGIVYDVIVEPPSIGSYQDPVTKSQAPVVIMKGRINGQYIIEGLSAGFFYVIGGFGFIMLEKGVRSSLWMLAGIVSLLFAYGFSNVFIRLKIPGYMH